MLDEHMGFWIALIESSEQFRVRFRSELQDFIAERSFGWRQLRE